MNSRSFLAVAEEILEGKETVINFPADENNRDFGVELIGGRHTYLGSICIHKIYKDSIAYDDGRLKRGDVVIAVNGKSTRKASLEEAKLALADSRNALQITIIRDPDPIKLFTSSEEPKIFVTAELWKAHANEPLGISLMERKNTGVFITWVDPQSSAGKCQRIRQGDKIIDINGRPVKGMSLSHVAATLREAEHSVVIVAGRIPSLYSAIQEWARDYSSSSAPMHRTSTWSYPDSSSSRHKSKKSEDVAMGKKYTRRFSAFNLRLRSNSTQMERLAIHGVNQEVARK